MTNGTNPEPGLAAQVIRGITLLAAEAAFVGLFVYFLVETWQAKDGTTPTFSDIQVTAAGALAVAIGAGYATVLGVQPAPGDEVAVLSRAWFGKVWGLLKERFLLLAGVALYMFTGFAVAVTYAFNENETPAILRTFAIAFGGYVIAYLGAAFRRAAV